MLTGTAAEIVETDQPNSARSGSISTPGTARNAAAPTRARNVTAATHQAGWMRGVRIGAVTRSAGPREWEPDEPPDGRRPHRSRRSYRGAAPDVTGDSPAWGAWRGD